MSDDEDGVLRDFWEGNDTEESVVLGRCAYVSFMSRSAGVKKQIMVEVKPSSKKKNGETKYKLKTVERWHRKERHVELVVYGDRTYSLRDDLVPDHLDRVVSELMADVFVPDESSMYAEFVTILRNSKKKRK